MADKIGKSIGATVKKEMPFIFWAIGILWIAIPVFLWVVGSAIARNPVEEAHMRPAPGYLYVVFIYVTVCVAAAGAPFLMPQRGKRDLPSILFRIIVGIGLSFILFAAVNLIALKMPFPHIAGTFFLLLLFAVFVFSFYAGFDSIPKIRKAAYPIALIAGYLALGWVFAEFFFYSIKDYRLQGWLLNLAIALNPSFALVNEYLHADATRMNIIYMRTDVMDLGHFIPGYTDSAKAYLAVAISLLVFSGWPLYVKVLRRRILRTDTR